MNENLYQNTRYRISFFFWFSLALIANIILFLALKGIVYPILFWVGVFTIFFLFIFPEFGLSGVITFSFIFPAIVETIGLQESNWIYILRMFIILLSLLFYLFFKRKSKVLPRLSVTNVFFTLFLLNILLGVLYSPLKEIGMNRAFLFAYAVGIPFYSLLFLEKEAVIKLFRWVLLVAFLFAFLTFFFGKKALSENRITLIGTGMITFGRFYGLATIIGFESYFAYRNMKSRLRYVYLLGVVLIAVSLFLTGTRGALVSLIVAFGFYVAFFAPISLRKKVLTIFMLLVVSGVILLFAQKGIAKYRILAINLAGSSVKFRLIMWKEAIKIFVQNPVFGIGTGGSSIDMGQFLLGTYPHNMLLEVLAEQGLIGLILFMGLVFGAVKTFIWLFHQDEKTRRVAGLCLSLFIYTFVSAMFSSTIGGNKEFFLLIAIIEGLATEKRGEIKHGTPVLQHANATERGV